VFGFAVPSLSLAASVMQSITNMTRVLAVAGGTGGIIEVGKCLFTKEI
jgi:hypothetical protein